MSGALLLDILLLVLLIGYIGFGISQGFTRSVGALAGVVLGAIAAYFLMPLVGAWVTPPFFRIVATVALGLGLIAAGHALGLMAGRAIRRTVSSTPLGVVDRILGGITTGIVTALVASMVSFTVGSLGFPFLTQAIASSAVLRTIDAVTPDVVQSFLARLRSVVIDDGIPRVAEALGVGVQSPGIPEFNTGTPALNLAAQSVVRITGHAFECGQSQTGTGFVVADDRVITNAHVVAGVAEPVIEAPGEPARSGRVVYFDPVDDLAVIAVGGLDSAALALSDTLGADSQAAVHGYPFGGPFVSSPAQVLSVSTIRVPDIYGRDEAPREVYTLAASVEQGNSGGPLLSQDGTVAGVVFAKALDEQDIGYAMTMAELGPVAAVAASLVDAVSAGSCTRA